MKQGDIVYHKASGEVLVVLEASEATVRVRRGYATKDISLVYDEAEFARFEVETAKDRFAREMALFESQQDKATVGQLALPMPPKVN